MNDLLQYEVGAADGALWSVIDFLLDDTSWTVGYLIADAGGILSPRPVLIGPATFAEVDYSASRIRLGASSVAAHDRPIVDADRTVSRPSERPHPPRADDPEEPAADPAWRSVREIRGYRIEATDGPVGHVQDLVVEDETWGIRYLVISTANWSPGKRVLLSPEWATCIRWKEREILVEMTRAAIRASPEWSATYPIGTEYADELARHYAGTPGWRGRDRTLETDPSRASPRGGSDDVGRESARVAAYEEETIQDADAAVVRHAREGRMP